MAGADEGLGICGEEHLIVVSVGFGIIDIGREAIDGVQGLLDGEIGDGDELVGRTRIVRYALTPFAAGDHGIVPIARGGVHFSGCSRGIDRAREPTHCRAGRRHRFTGVAGRHQPAAR